MASTERLTGWELRVLGPVAARDGGRPVNVGGPREQGVLALLVLGDGHRCSAERLARGIWGEAQPSSAVKTVRGYVSRLRGVLGSDVIAIEHGGYRLKLNTAAGTVTDVSRFEQLVAAGRSALTSDPSRFAEADRILGEALSLWRGENLAEGAALDTVQPDATRLIELRLGAEVDRFEAWLALGRHAEVVAEVERLIVRHPLHERLWIQLMVALYRQGRQADALAAYQRARSLLAAELGLEPGPALRKLELQVLQQSVDVAAHLANQPVLSARPGGRLPATISSFVGRETELGEVATLLGSARLVTLVGVGGVGKTRLALEVAERQVTTTGAPAWFVDLASVESGHLVAATVMAALDEPERSDHGPLDVLAARLTGTPTVLVVDNCEHLLDDCATLVQSLLSACPELIVLATSRAPLGVGGEITYLVPPLGVPDSTKPSWRSELLAGYDSVQLFIVRSRDLHPAPALLVSSMDTVARICRRLDGLPLAIELAAAQLRSLSLFEIAERLDDRFTLLGKGPRAAPARHHTLHAAIDWSHALLAADEQVLLRRLSVFANDFTLGAVFAVVGADISADDTLHHLVAASLVTAEPRNTVMRYHLYETIRQYGAEKLKAAGESVSTARRHASYFLGVAEQADAALFGPAERRWFAALDLDLDNIRAALNWAATESGSEDGDLLARLAAAMGSFWRIRGTHAEASHWLTLALHRTREPGRLRGRLLLWLGAIETRRCQFDQAEPLLTEAVTVARLIDDHALLGLALHWRGFLAKSQRRHDEAVPLFQEAATLRQAIGDIPGTAMSLGSLADIAMVEGRYDEAALWYEQGLTMMRQAETAQGVVMYLHSMAELETLRRHFNKAEQLALEALSIAREIGETWHVGLLHQVLACVARHDGDMAAAISHSRIALSHFCELRELDGVATTIELLAGIALDDGRAVRAAQLFAGAKALRASKGVPITVVRRAQLDADIARADELAGDAADEAHQRGQGLHLEALIDCALNVGTESPEMQTPSDRSR